ncbi:sodium channel modifier 1 [Quercus suber]|uniref:Sodium channel modifier 1 n=1 Tax=Quercus suber TaxID=58331 RepID=A0AAW0L096_QUESU
MGIADRVCLSLIPTSEGSWVTAVRALRRPQRRTSKTYSIGKPLIEQTQNVALEILNNKTPQQKSSIANCDFQLIVDRLTDGNSNLSQNSSCPAIQATDKVVVQPHLDFQECRERELKFIATGWKRDCLGKWFRDENVEFDSDEDDPNVCLG